MPTVLVPLAQGSEELEAVTIIDVLRRAEINVITASLDGNTITASRGVKLVADTSLDKVVNQEFDMIVLPGGVAGATHLDEDERIHRILKKMSQDGKYTAAICAAPKVLANAGLLEGKMATSYPGFIDKMDLPQTRVLEDTVVIDDKVITSRGPGTAMDFALALVEKLSGKEKRDTVEAGLLRPTN